MDKPFRSLFIQIILMVIMSFFAPDSSISSQSPQIKGMIIDDVTHLPIEAVDVTARTTDLSFSVRTDGFGKRSISWEFYQMKVRFTNGVKFIGQS
jgi:hypothetical protein